MPISGEKLRRKLKVEAEAQRIPPQVRYVQWVMEGLLRRVQRSQYAGKLILKGTATSPVRYGRWQRQTRCLDFHCIGHMSAAAIRRMVADVAAMNSIDDGIVFEACSVVHQWPRTRLATGLFVRVRARLGTIVVPLKLFLDFGHEPPMQAAYRPFPSLQDGYPAVRVLCTSPSSAVAEKLVPLVEFGGSNTRVQDYHDIWLLIATFEFEAPVVIEAAKHVIGSRGLGKVLQQGNMSWQEGLSDEYAFAQAARWSAWVRKQHFVDQPPALVVVVHRVRDFATPLLHWIAEGAMPDRVWIPGSGWSGGPDAEPALKMAA